MNLIVNIYYMYKYWMNENLRGNVVEVVKMVANGPPLTTRVQGDDFRAEGDARTLPKAESQ